MKKTLRTLSVATAIAGAAVVAVPVAAQASTIYPPTNACSVNLTTTQPRGTVIFSCEADTFAADEAVTITVTGESGSYATYAIVRTAISTGSYTARSGDEGELPGVKITFPSNGIGVYNIAAVSPSSAGGAASVTVALEGDDPLVGTGGDVAAIVPWAIGGLALVGGGAFALVAVGRRRRERS